LAGLRLVGPRLRGVVPLLGVSFALALFLALFRRIPFLGRLVALLAALALRRRLTLLLGFAGVLFAVLSWFPLGAIPLGSVFLAGLVSALLGLLAFLRLAVAFLAAIARLRLRFACFRLAFLPLGGFARFRLAVLGLGLGIVRFGLLARAGRAVSLLGFL